MTTKMNTERECIRVHPYGPADNIPLCSEAGCTHILLPGETHCPCHQKNDYERDRSHSHCWESNNPPCGIKGKHRCCLCEKPVPQKNDSSGEGWEKEFEKLYDWVRPRSLYIAFKGFIQQVVIPQVAQQERKNIIKFIRHRKHSKKYTVGENQLAHENKSGWNSALVYIASEVETLTAPTEKEK